MSITDQAEAANVGAEHRLPSSYRIVVAVPTSGRGKRCADSIYTLQAVEDCGRVERMIFCNFTELA